MRPRTKPSAVLLLWIILLLILPSCSPPVPKTIEETKFFMDTAVRIEVVLSGGIDEARARLAISKAFDEIRRVEDIFSIYRQESEVSKINRLGKDEKLRVSEEVFELIKKSLEFSKKTNGSFDITVKPLVDLWRTAKNSNKLPSDEEIKLALNRVGYKNIVLDKKDRSVSFKKDGMALDFGGAAKGYAADRAAAVLKKNGVENAIVNPGGSVYCMGRKSETELWKVGIRHPRYRGRIFFEIKLEDMAIDTSGDYERYFILNGKRYSHIIDPRTGYPIGDDVVSSSIIAPDAAAADILATSLAVLGDQGMATARSIKGVDAIIVFRRDGKFIVNMTDGIGKHYEVRKENL